MKNVFKTKKEIQWFFRKQGITYLKRTRIGWQPLSSIKLDASPYYRENKGTFTELSRKYAAHIEDSSMAPVYIKQIDKDLGYGLFAADHINRRAFIGEYTGVVQPAEDDTAQEVEAGGFRTDYSWYYLDEIEGGPSLEINGRLEGNELRFVNHSFKPNLEVEHILHAGQWIIFFVASRNIKKDEQLLIDYGEDYWDGTRQIKRV